MTKRHLCRAMQQRMKLMLPWRSTGFPKWSIGLLQRLNVAGPACAALRQIGLLFLARIKTAPAFIGALGRGVPAFKQPQPYLLYWLPRYWAWSRLPLMIASRTPLMRPRALPRLLPMAGMAER